MVLQTGALEDLVKSGLLAVGSNTRGHLEEQVDERVVYWPIALSGQPTSFPKSNRKKGITWKI